MVESQEWHDEEIVEPDKSQYPLSASGIKKFKRCPKEFELRYIQNKESLKPSGGHADLGTAVHESIERVLSENSIAELSETPNQLKELMVGEYRSIDPDIDDDKYETGLSCLEVAARYTAMSSANHFDGVEMDFTYALGREDVDHSFRGTMDVASPDAVWDWKTGTNVYEEDEIIQGMVYAMGYLDEFGRPPEEIRFVYLQKEVERVVQPTDENWEQMLDVVRDIVEAKRTGSFPAQPDSSKCYWCSYEGHCSAASTGAGNVGWSQI